MTFAYSNVSATPSIVSVASTSSGVSPNKDNESLISHGSRDNSVPHSTSLLKKMSLRFGFLQKTTTEGKNFFHRHNVRHVRIPDNESQTTAPSSQAQQQPVSDENTRLLGKRPMTASDAVHRAIVRHDGDLLSHEGRMKQAAAFIRDLAEIEHPDEWAAATSDKDKAALWNESLLEAPRLLTDFVKTIGDIESGHSSQAPGKARKDMQLNALATAHKAFEFLDRHAYVTGDTTQKLRQSGLPNTVNISSRRSTPVFDTPSRAAFADAVATLCVQNMNNRNWKTPHTQSYLAEVEFDSGLRSTNPGPGAVIGLAMAPFKSVSVVIPGAKRQDKTLNHAVNLLAKAIKSYGKPDPAHPEKNLDRGLIDKCSTLLKNMPAESSMRMKLYKVLVSRIDHADKVALDRGLAADTPDATPRR